MNSKRGMTGGARDEAADSVQGPVHEPMIESKIDSMIDPVMEQALGEFRQSVEAWSEAAYSRPREVRVRVHRSWRLAAGWALGCVLAAGSLGGGIYEHHERAVVARQAAEAKAAEEKRIAAEQKAKETDENLMAAVDSDVSRDVPAAMEPLAQLMDGDGSK